MGARMNGEVEPTAWKSPWTKRQRDRRRANLLLGVEAVLLDAHASTYMRHDIGDQKLRTEFIRQLVDYIFIPALERCDPQWRPKAK